MSDISRHSPVTREKEQELARRIQKGDEDAVRELVEANLGFVIVVAKSYMHCGTPFEDLLNEGNIGLIEAAHRFDPDRGLRFITYAVWWIRRSILQAITGSRLVRLPKYKVRELHQFRKAAQELRTRLERTPTREEVSDATGRSAEEVEEFNALGARELSLDAPSPMTEQTLCDTLPGTTPEVMEKAVHRKELGEVMGWAMGFLNERERKVLTLRYGFRGSDLTLEQVGRKLQLTKERVRQIENRARKRLRNILTSRYEEFQAMACC
jgi:RNA polymerase primary sigma factor